MLFDYSVEPVKPVIDKLESGAFEVTITAWVGAIEPMHNPKHESLMNAILQGSVKTPVHEFNQSNAPDIGVSGSVTLAEDFFSDAGVELTIQITNSHNPYKDLGCLIEHLDRKYADFVRAWCEQH